MCESILTCMLLMAYVYFEVILERSVENIRTEEYFYSNMYPLENTKKSYVQLAQLLRREHPGGSHWVTQHLHPVGQFKSHVPEYALHASQGVCDLKGNSISEDARSNSIKKTALSSSLRQSN